MYKQKYEDLVLLMTKTATTALGGAAERKQDEEMLIKIRGFDLITKGARHHASRYKEYTRFVDRYT